MEDLFQKRKRQLLVGVIAVIAVILAVSAFFIIRAKIYSATLNVVVSPSTAKIKIGDKEYNTSVGEIKLKPGEYEVEVFADGFVTKKGKMTLVEDGTFNFALYLDPTDDNADWYEDHPWDATARGDIINNTEIQNYYDLKEVEPILDYVPYNAYNYSIGYEEDCVENKNEICLIVKGDFGMADVAMRYLQNTNQDLSRYFLKYDVAVMFNNIRIDVPESLIFDEDEASGAITSEEVGIVRAVAEDFANRSLASNKYVAEVLQIKSYGNYCGVKIKVYNKDGDEKIFDTYRMILYKNNGEWKAITNLAMILSKYINDKIPTKLLQQVDAW